MPVSHLTDEQIQLYLDGGAVGEPVVEHLHSCPVCRRELHAYRQLYRELRQDPEEELAPGFAETVMVRLASESARPARSSRAVSVLACLGIAAAVVSAVYFVNLGVVWGVTATVTAYLGRIAVHVVDALQSSTASMGIPPHLGIFTGLVLLTVALLDHLLIFARRRHICL